MKFLKLYECAYRELQIPFVHVTIRIVWRETPLSEITFLKNN